MQKYFFHNGKSINQSIVNKSTNNKISLQTRDIDKKKVVDINKLLNRVKINKKNEIIRKIIFYSFIIFGLSSAGVLISFLK